MGLRDAFEEGLQQSSGMKIGCGVAGGACLLAVAIPTVIYGGLGWLGWSVVKSKVVYEDRYYEASRYADKNRDGNIDTFEAKAWFDEMGVTKRDTEDYVHIRPAFDKLEEFIDKYE